MRFIAKPLVYGVATGQILHSTTPLSFWGGIDQETGSIIDHHHPLFRQNIKDRILVLPSTRGSCTGSLIIIELLLNNVAPAAIIFCDREEIVSTGVIVARILLKLSIPVLRVERGVFGVLGAERYLSILDGEIVTGKVPLSLYDSMPLRVPKFEHHVELTKEDKQILDGSKGAAASKAMEILLHYAYLQNAKQLTPVSRAHIDACIYTGPASLTIAQTFLNSEGKVAVPTTLNSISIDQRRWRELGVDETLAREANRLAETYVAMGARNSFTCAPYLLDSPPQSGESIGWAESNAVVFANSVLGARTQKYPDLTDVCIALTGRAPLAGTQTEDGRVPRVCVGVSDTVQNIETMEDAFYPLLGYAIGRVVGGDIPLIFGLETTKPTISDLKAFGAAFATTASAPMFHITGATPEAMKLSPAGLPHTKVTQDNIRSALTGLTTAKGRTVGLVSLGNPHFSLEEFARLSELCAGRHKSESVQFIITTSRDVCAKACAAGYDSAIGAFGGEILTDTCWCMMSESVIDTSVVNLMTNSAKYAHYAPGIVNRGVHFGCLRECVDAAERGVFNSGMVI
ncbi:uncharacterized protein BDV14DRAFT_209610 [Aspergillus stella-maris]|uniref:uncharacterized protein n=1 Tax=Aspergillus stella-maris TaxID=1810926 RepID=UPI003CCE28A7